MFHKAILLAAALSLFTVASLRAEESTPPAAPKVGAEKKTAREAALKATQFLLTQANENGTFGKPPSRDMPGVVGLVLYAITKSPDKPTPAQVPELRRAADYLASVQMESGAIAIPQFGLENYNTSVAIVALKALNDPKYEQVLDKALKYVLKVQLDEEEGYDKDEHYASFGAFHYGNAKRGDLSNTSFSLDALKAMGVKEDSEAYKNALVFIKRAQDNLETNDAANMRTGDNTGAFVYLPGESEFGTVKSRKGVDVPKPYGSMTYAGIKALIYCGLKDDSPELKAAWKWIVQNYSVSSAPGHKGTDGYYYYLVAMAKAFTAAGKKELTLPDGTKAHWAKDLAKHLGSLQDEDGSFANKSQRWMEGDRLLATAYALQALNLAFEALE